MDVILGGGGVGANFLNDSCCIRFEFILKFESFLPVLLDVSDVGFVGTIGFNGSCEGLVIPEVPKLLSFEAEVRKGVPDLLGIRGDEEKPIGTCPSFFANIAPELPRLVGGGGGVAFMAMLLLGVILLDLEGGGNLLGRVFVLVLFLSGSEGGVLEILSSKRFNSANVSALKVDSVDSADD